MQFIYIKNTQAVYISSCNIMSANWGLGGGGGGGVGGWSWSFTPKLKYDYPFLKFCRVLVDEPVPICNKNTRTLRRYQSYFAFLKLAVVKIRGRLPFTIHVFETFNWF